MTLGWESVVAALLPRHRVGEAFVRIRRSTAFVAVLATVAAMGVATVGTASAVQVPQTSLVTADPANFTPNVTDGKVESIVQVGNEIYAAGLFGHVQLPGNNKPILARTNIFAFNATTGVIDTALPPDLRRRDHHADRRAGRPVALRRRLLRHRQRRDLAQARPAEHQPTAPLTAGFTAAGLQRQRAGHAPGPRPADRRRRLHHGRTASRAASSPR